jgi:hypothetical protein
MPWGWTWVDAVGLCTVPLRPLDVPATTLVLDPRAAPHPRNVCAGVGGMGGSAEFRR